MPHGRFNLGLWDFQRIQFDAVDRSRKFTHNAIAVHPDIAHDLRGEFRRCHLAVVVSAAIGLRDFARVRTDGCAEVISRPSDAAISSEQRHQTLPCSCIAARFAIMLE